ncbi:MAG: helix-turn-helix transcriptional regulator [Bacteroidaceae bacterium]|nr:helix-turn-helix transcriptional regulator [Bacteroidaceae bacterium]
MAKMKTYTLDELTDKYIGKIGTPERDKYEKDLKEELQAYHIGEAIKQARIAKNLTQEQLGERIGVQRAQISRLEKGKSLTFSSLTRIFKAMEIPLTLDMGGIGKISLC